MNNALTAAPSSHRVLPLDPGLVPALAEAHAACFPDYFLTCMGPSYLRVFYGALLRSSLGVTVLVVDEAGCVLGFAVGATNGQAFRKFLYRHHFIRTVATVLWKFCTTARVRFLVLSKRERIWKGLRLVFSRGLRRSDPKAPSHEANDAELRRHWAEAVTLMSMGARPECRGKGIAEETIRAFETEARKVGGCAVKLSTGKENVRAIGFYEKCGYVLYSDARPKGVDYLKVL